jgi:predicted RND superfamily exporter protein
LNTIYLFSEDSTLNGALEKCEKNYKLLKHPDLNSKLDITSITNFYPSISEQKDRINRWNEFILKNYSLINTYFKDELRKNGFNEEAFSKYFQITDNKYQICDVDFSKLLGEISKQHICEFNDKFYVVDKVSVPFKDTENIKSVIKEQVNNINCFDVKSMNNAISQTLSDEFDYIGLSCGFIVFIFLWLSLGRIELSIMAFLPMAISWIWILGIMGITGIQFNIVNVILATFIFGQGDDYTIFMTEGLLMNMHIGKSY